MGREIRITVDLSPRRPSALTLAAMLAAIPLEIGSESLTLTTSYPPPAGIYHRIVTTGTGNNADTLLSRDDGLVLLAPPTNPTGAVRIGTDPNPQYTPSLSESVDVAGTTLYPEYRFEVNGSAQRPNVGVDGHIRLSGVQLGSELGENFRYAAYASNLAARISALDQAVFAVRRADVTAKKDLNYLAVGGNDVLNDGSGGAYLGDNGSLEIANKGFIKACAAMTYTTNPQAACLSYNPHAIVVYVESKCDEAWGGAAVTQCYGPFQNSTVIDTELWPTFPVGPGPSPVTTHSSWPARFKPNGEVVCCRFEDDNP